MEATRGYKYHVTMIFQSFTRSVTTAYSGNMLQIKHSDLSG